MQASLRYIAKYVLVYALLDYPPEVKALFLENMSDMACKMQKEDMVAVGTVSEDKIKAAQRDVVGAYIAALVERG